MAELPSISSKDIIPTYLHTYVNYYEISYGNYLQNVKSDSENDSEGFDYGSFIRYIPFSSQG